MTPTNDIKLIAEALGYIFKHLTAGVVYVTVTDPPHGHYFIPFNLSDPAIQLEMIKYLAEFWSQTKINGEFVYRKYDTVISNESLEQCVIDAMLKQIKEST